MHIQSHRRQKKIMRNPTPTLKRKINVLSIDIGTHNTNAQLVVISRQLLPIPTIHNS